MSEEEYHEEDAEEEQPEVITDTLEKPKKKLKATRRFERRR